MADIRVDELTQETLQTLTDAKKFVMFDTEEGKSATLGIIKSYITSALQTAITSIQSALTIDEAQIADNVTVIATEYSSSETYSVGDYVMYGNALYRCKTAIQTPEAWTASHWESSNIGSVNGTLFW